MEVIYSLIPGMTFFGLIFLAILIIVVRSGQYEDMEGNAQRILQDDDDEFVPAIRKESAKQESDTPTPPAG